MTRLKEENRWWIVEINPTLPHTSTTKWKNDIIRMWGTDWKGNEKLIQVLYPKKEYSKEYIEEVIMPQYDECKLCQIGRSISKKLKYSKKDIKSMRFSVLDLMEKIPKLGGLIRRHPEVSEQWIMQILGTITQYPISIVGTEFGQRLLNFVLGLGGSALIEKFAQSPNLKSEWHTFFANLGASGIGPDKSNRGYGAGDDLKRLARNVMSGNFGALQSQIISPNMKSKLRRLRGQIGMAFSNIFGAFGKIGSGRMWETPTTHSPKLSNSGSPGNFQAGESDDFGYADTQEWFQDVSDFGPNFLNKKRFRKSGDLSLY